MATEIDVENLIISKTLKASVKGGAVNPSSQRDHKTRSKDKEISNKIKEIAVIVTAVVNSLIPDIRL
jgi:hypothetical protein